MAIGLVACAQSAPDRAGERTGEGVAQSALLTCEHDTCTTGGPLDPSCDACAADICAVDPFCCDVAWDGICVNESETVCGIDCNTGPCPHDKCTEGVKLAPSCGSCEAAICANDPFCCNVGWDATCVDKVKTICNNNECEARCPHNRCVTGGPLDPTCGECEETICAVDPFCCDVAWDGICKNEVLTVCGETCPAGIAPTPSRSPSRK